MDIKKLKGICKKKYNYKLSKEELKGIEEGRLGDFNNVIKIVRGIFLKSKINKEINGMISFVNSKIKKDKTWHKLFYRNEMFGYPLIELDKKFDKYKKSFLMEFNLDFNEIISSRKRVESIYIDNFNKVFENCSDIEEKTIKNFINDFEFIF